MAVYAPLSDVTIEAFQWLGDPLADYDLPGWALGLHAPSDGTLHVPCWNGTFGARIGDWIVRAATGEVMVLPNSLFEGAYDINAERKAAAAAEAKAASNKAAPASKKD